MLIISDCNPNDGELDLQGIDDEELDKVCTKHFTLSLQKHNLINTYINNVKYYMDYSILKTKNNA